MDIMLDIETLSTKCNAVVLTVGAVKFDPYSNADPDDPYYARLDIEKQSLVGRDINSGTLEWWSKQSKEIQEEAMDEEDRISVDQFLDDISKYIVGADNLWGQGYGFDYGIIETLFHDFERPTPWNFWQLKDSRTLFSCLPMDPREKNQDLHNSLADSYMQAIGVQKAYKLLGIKPRR